MTFPDHRIPFPVAKPLPGVDHRRTFINRDLIGDPPPATIAAIALPPRFLTPQGAVEIASRLFILIDIRAIVESGVWSELKRRGVSGCNGCCETSTTTTKERRHDARAYQSRRGRSRTNRLADGVFAIKCP